VRAISEVIKAVALGDLSKQVQVDAQGEMLDLMIMINSMVNQLHTLADEITRVSLEVGTEGTLGGQAMDLLKTQIDQMIFSFRESIQKNTAARESAERTNRSKSEFLAVVSRDIRSVYSNGSIYFSLFILEPHRVPMNGIIGLAELTLESELNRSQRESILIIQSLTRSLVLMIDDLSDISKRKCLGKRFSVQVR
jgi:osomolarity two-component system, sensor histidine kinase NIK1